MAVLDVVVTKLEALVPSLTSHVPFRRSTEVLKVEDLPAKACFRRFNVDGIEGRDLSQEQDGGVENVGMADRTARFRIRVAYPLGRREKDLDKLIPSDAEIAMRGLARSADWTGTPISSARVRWSIDRTSSQDKWFLELQVELNYRDVEA